MNAKFFFLITLIPVAFLSARELEEKTKIPVQEPLCVDASHCPNPNQDQLQELLDAAIARLAQVRNAQKADAGTMEDVRRAHDDVAQRLDHVEGKSPYVRPAALVAGLGVAFGLGFALAVKLCTPAH